VLQARHLNNLEVALCSDLATKGDDLFAFLSPIGNSVTALKN
jgi:hypothetical protein